MFVRVRFAKFGAVKYIGHLDVMRYFQKALRRSGVDVAYTSGYHPHQIMSFAMPLGVGVTSDGEYMDLEMNTAPSKEELMLQLKSAVSEGFDIIDVALLGERVEGKHHENSMALVSAADYYVSFKPDRELPFTSFEEMKVKFEEFISKATINVVKKTKTSEAEIDIKPFVYDYSFDYAGFGSEEKDEIVHAEEGDLFGVYLRLSAGSVMNIKPQLVMEAFYKHIGAEYNKFDFHVHRMNMYAGTKNERVSLLTAGN